MRVLDLYSGLRGWSEPWRERGHEVVTVDFDGAFEPDMLADVGKIWIGDLPWRPDVVLASPPCERFTVLRIGKNWTHSHQPRNKQAWEAMRLVRLTVDLIEDLEPAFWVVENPVGKLRRLRTGLEHYERRTVTYCQYGMRWRKATDLWGGFPPSLTLAPQCHNGDPCHVAAPRGSTTGVQSSALAAERAKVPKLLSLAMMEACERDITDATLNGRLFA
jgi:hypothetical protein